MKSMTGYGQAIIERNNHKIQIEIQSVNGKKHELYPIIPKDWLILDFKVREFLRTRISRGKVTVRISIENIENETSIKVDPKKWNQTIKQLEELSKSQNIGFKPDPNTLYRIAKDLQKESKKDLETVFPHLEKAMEIALFEMLDMQKKEGSYLLKDLQGRIEKIASKQNKIQKLSESASLDYRKQLINRLEESELKVDLEDERILKEIALYADRIDVSEENIRLKSHIEQFQKTLEKEASVGRLLDFLCQEIFRELNTLSAKCRSIELINLTLECKNELERIREQVQNIA